MSATPATRRSSFRPSSWAEGVGTFAVAMLVLPWIGSSSYRESLIVLFMVYALIALGIYIPLILGGSLSLAYNAYFGIGAYSVAIIGTKTDFPILLAVPIGMVLSAIVAANLGWVTRGLSGFYLAAVTLLFGQTFERWLVDASSITGGAFGISGIPDPGFFGLVLSRRAVVIAGIVFLWAATFAVSRLRRGLFGVSLRTYSEVPVAAEASGVRTKQLEITGLAVGAAVASVAGGLLTFANGFVGADSFTVHIVFLALFMPLLGGQASPWGVIIGAALVVQLTLGVTLFEQTGSLFFGVGVLIVLLIAPNGILGFVRSVLTGLRDLVTGNRKGDGGE